MKKIFMFGILLVAMVSLVAGCGSSENEKSAKKVLRVGTEATFAPFEFQEEGSKDYTGFDMDLARSLAKKMGRDIEIVNMGFDALIPALNAGNIDMAIAGITITAEREKHITFGAPYYQSGLKVMVKKDNNTIDGIEDLKGKKIAVQIGTTGALAAHKVEGATVTEYNTNTEAALELKNGGVDAIIQDLPVAAYFLQQGGGNEYAKLVGPTLSAEEYGIAVKKGDKELASEIAVALDDLKKNGEYNKVYEKWFGKMVK